MGPFYTRCPRPQQTQFTSALWPSNMSLQADNKSEVFKCGTCEYWSESREEWNEHRRTVHQLLALDEEEAENYKYPTNERASCTDDRVISNQVLEDRASQ